MSSNLGGRVKFKSSFLPLASLIAVLVVAFTNCSRISHEISDDALTAKGNGDFYAGKIFHLINPGQCSDGSDIVSTLVFTSDIEAQFLPENCLDLAMPRYISANVIAATDNPDVILVEGLAFTAAVAPPTTASPTPANLVLNGGFENGFADFAILGGNPTISNDAFAGSSAVVTNPTVNWSWLQQGISPTLLTAGRTYTLRAAAKISGGTAPLKIAFKIDNDVELATLMFDSNSYEAKEASFVLPAGITWSVLFVEMGNPDPATTSATLDEISLIESP